jgi:threonyl-tRNA synthetase
MQLNDAHLFCAPDQVAGEVAGVLRLMDAAHAALGLRPSARRLSLRGEGGKYGGGGAMWERAERLLRAALDGYAYQEAPGEAAFYGPKIDVQVVDPAGREWTLATVQLDFHQPAQFDLGYAAPDGGRGRPVMVHRSLVGSMERLFGHLIEVHRGAFPVWFAPVQVEVVPVGADQADAADAFAAEAVGAGLRTEAHHHGSVGARIRSAAERKIPYVAVIGAREAENGLVALRLRDGRQLPPQPATEAIGLITAVAEARSGSPDALLP